MNTAIVTIVSDKFVCLFDMWHAGIRKWLPEYPVVLLDATTAGMPVIRGVELVRVNRHALSLSEESHAAGWKMLLFSVVPRKYSGLVFLDLDVLFFSRPTALFRCMEESESRIAMVPDYFVGYKEKLEEEMRQFDPTFCTKFFPDGRYYYFNTGVWWALREHDAVFLRSYENWEKFYNEVGSLPAILDQNIINYTIMKHGVEIAELPCAENCLRQYPIEIDGNGRPMLEGAQVSVMHFNGGAPELKVKRMRESLRAYVGDQ